MVVNPKSFLAELDELHAHGVSTGNLVISDRAHMVMPYHPVFDQLGEHQRGDDRLGTTHRGIGPAYEDKVRRVGFRVGDLSKPVFLEKKLRFVLRLKNESLTRLYGHEPFDERAILDEYLGYAERLEPYIRDIYPIIQGALRDGSADPLRGRPGGDARPRPGHLSLRDLIGAHRRWGAHRQRHPALQGDPDDRGLQGLHHPGRLRPLPHRAGRHPRRADPGGGLRVRHRDRPGAPGGLVRRRRGALLR